MIFYVTGAPNKLSGFSLRFLLNSGFPLGPVLPRESTDVSTLEHKVEAITRIIEHLPPSTIILVGDNGEHDVEPRRDSWRLIGLSQAAKADPCSC